MESDWAIHQRKFKEEEEVELEAFKVAKFEQEPEISDSSGTRGRGPFLLRTFVTPLSKLPTYACQQTGLLSHKRPYVPGQSTSVDNLRPILQLRIL